MGWKEERDALIAQTLAFVEQVTGKPVDFAQLAPPSMPVSAPHHSSAAPVSAAPRSGAGGSEPAGWESASAPAEQDILAAEGSVELGAANDAGEAVSSSSAPEPDSSSPSESAPVADEGAAAGSFRATPFKSTPSPALTAQLGIQRNMQDEIRARIASFRAHQERFNRERQEYFTATLARLRASIEQTSRNDNK